MKTHTIPSSVSYVINFMTWDVSESLDLLEFHDGFRSGRWLSGFKSHRLITWSLDPIRYTVVRMYFLLFKMWLIAKFELYVWLTLYFY